MNTDSAIKILAVAVVLSFVCTAGVAVWLNNQSDDCKDTETVYCLYVGLSNDSGEEIDYDVAVAIAGKVIMEYGDGMTVSKATGAWTEDGTFITETSMVIELAGFSLDKVHKICDQLKKDLKQKSIMITATKEVVEFY